MREPIVLGLGAETSDEELEAKAAGIRGRLQAFAEEVQALSRRYNVWLSGNDETPLLVDGATEERAGYIHRTEDQAYSVEFVIDVEAPAKYRRQAIARERERRRQRKEQERQLAEWERQAAEYEARMRAEGWQREEFTLGAYGQLLSNVPANAEQYAGGTAGNWWRPRHY